MMGELTEKFVVMTGTGGNGKGVLDELHTVMLGNYYHKGSVAVLTNPLKTGGNPEVANIHCKRTVVYTEPEDHLKLVLSTVKTLTGDSVVSARQLYSNQTSTTNHATTILECNELPAIGGRIDDSAARRFINIRFPCRYTDDPNDVDLLAGAPNVYARNLKYKSPQWREGHKHAFFELMRQYTQATPQAPREIIVDDKLRAYTREYLNKCDIGAEWFRENFVRVDDWDSGDVPLSAKDIYAQFEVSLDYLQLTRDDKRGWTQGRFIERLKNALKSDYKDMTQVGGKKLRRVVVNWRRSEEAAF